MYQFLVVTLFNCVLQVPQWEVRVAVLTIVPLDFIALHQAKVRLLVLNAAIPIAQRVNTKSSAQPMQIQCA